MSVAVLCFTRLCLCINFGAIADISDLIFVLLFQVVEASALCCSHFGYNRSGCKINIFFFRFCAPFSFSSHKKCISPWYFLFSTTVTTTIPQSKTGCGSSFPRCVLELQILEYGDNTHPFLISPKIVLYYSVFLHKQILNFLSSNKNSSPDFYSLNFLTVLHFCRKAVFRALLPLLFSATLPHSSSYTPPRG